MTKDRGGKVVTFYSYKGGTGRTMALANVAWILAANGKRVLVADWDLESPGLHRFFRPFIDPEELRSAGGVIDLVRGYEQATAGGAPRAEDWHRDYAKVSLHAFSIRWDHFPSGGSLDFLAAGDENLDYAQSLYQRDWDDFYTNLAGGQFFDALRADMKAGYDYALIDSRTGWSDVAGICTVHMPDVLVDCFTFSEQGIDGAARIAARIPDQRSDRPIRILPVPMRVDPAEQERADAGRMVARQRFAGLPAGMTDTERDAYWGRVEVPYRAFYAYEETLATFGDRPGFSTSMLSAYETLTSYITDGEVAGLPAVEENLRARTAARFVRHAEFPEEKVWLRYASPDRLWAEWIARLLETAGVTVHLATPGTDGAAAAEDRREVTVISHTNAAAETGRVPRDHHDPRGPLFVYVADVRPLPGTVAANSAFLTGQAERVAADRLLKLVGHRSAEIDLDSLGLRYPGRSTPLFNAPIRNVHFTGREEELLELRENLQSSTATVVLSGATPVALQGMGGIGKTQVAMEYAHRFRNAYDAVWWVNADPPAFIDTQLSDLGRELGLGTEGSIADQAATVLATLGRGDRLRRWLLVFDNAEEVDAVTGFLPSGGGGHVLVTSRNPQWGDRTQVMQVEVFDRPESVAHIRQRVPSIRADQAARVAELLGDLPIAVAAAGAWLKDTGTPIGEYLRQIERHGPSIPDRGSGNPSLETTWDLSLQRLQERSPAAYRLLQLCSVLAPEISLELVYSDRMADLLTPLDASVSEAMYRGALVQQINRLALLKLDVGGGQIQVHRLLQHVVRQRMTEADLDEARRQVHLVLAAARPSGQVDDPQTWPRYRMLWPHLDVSRAYSSREESVRRLMIDRVRYVWQAGAFADARRIGERIVRQWDDLMRSLTGDAERLALERQSLHLQFNIGNAIREQALFEESRALNERVLARQIDLLGEYHPHTLMTAGSLAADLRALGLYAEALRRDERTYAAWLDNFGDDNPRTLLALNNLAVSHRLNGDFRSARERDLLVYQRGRIVQGESHPNTLNAGNNLGRDLREAGDYAGSIKLLREVAARSSAALGAGSPRTQNVLTNLAVSIRSAGRAHEAAPLLEAAYEVLNQTFGPSNSDTLACRLSRAVNLLSADEIDSADSEMKEVEQAYRAGLGEFHPHTLACVNNRAAIARAAGELRSAAELAAHARVHFAQVLGPDHPYTLAALMNQSIIEAERGAVPAAHQQLEPVAQRLPQILGPDHPDTLRCQANLLLMSGDLHGRSMLDGERMVRRLAGALGEDHPAVAAMAAGRFLHRTLDPHPF